MSPASYDSDETLYGAPAPKKKLKPNPASAASIHSETDSTLYGGGSTATQKKQQKTIVPAVPPIPARGDEHTLYAAPTPAPTKRTQPAVPPIPAREDEHTLYAAPTPAPTKRTLPAVPPVPAREDEHTLYAAPTPAPAKRTPLPAVPSSPAQEDEHTLYAAPTPAPTKRTLPAVPPIPAREDEHTLYAAPTPSPTKRTPLPAVPPAPAQEDEHTLYAAPTPSPTKRTQPAVPSIPAREDEHTLYAAPTSAPAKRPLPTAPPNSKSTDDTEYNKGPEEEHPKHTTEQQDTGSSSEYSISPLPNGSCIGNHKEYTIEKHLGKGGFGHTYLVRKGKVKHVVKECAPLRYSQRDSNGAIHPISGYEKDFNELRNYFSNEVDILNAANGKDKCIVHLVDEFDDNHTKYYVMAHLPGGSLYDLRIKKARFSEEELRKVLEDILGALQALHTASIIHRDIKPQNIMLTESNDSMLIDFGSASFTGTRAKAIRAATPQWAPPEEFTKDYTAHIGPHTDLYAVGTTIYYLITGKLFHHPELVETLKKIYEEQIYPDTEEVQELMARYLERPRDEIMEMASYSTGFRKALCAALEPEIGKRLASAQEWLNLISKETLKNEQDKEDLHKIDEIIKTHPDRIDEGTIEKLQQLKANLSSATLSLAKCYKHLWNKADDDQMPKDAQRNQANYEAYLKEAREHEVKGSFQESANHLLRQHCGQMDEPSLKKAIDWYNKDEMTPQAESCMSALNIMRDYKHRAQVLGFAGAHNMYLQGKQSAKECALMPQEGAQHIHAHLRGLAQLLCLLLSCGLCLPLIWLMSLLEYKKVSKYIAPIHLPELKD